MVREPYSSKNPLLNRKNTTYKPFIDRAEKSGVELFFTECSSVVESSHDAKPERDLEKVTRDLRSDWTDIIWCGKTPIQCARDLGLLVPGDGVIAEHERIRHARGGDGSFGLAIPDVSGEHDSVLAFPSSLSGDEADLRSQNRFYRAWWAVAHLFDEVHEEEPPEPPLICDQACPDIAVVVYHQGEDDTSTRGTFFEISRAVVRGLRALGLRARLTHCVDASQGCDFQNHERCIHLATHNLQVFLDLATMAPLILKRRDFLPRFSDDVAFNFEYVPLAINATEVEEASAKRTDAVQNAHGSFATAAALATLQKAARVWDYSLANVEPLSTLTHVEHVPLGWSTAWRPHRELSRLIEEKDIPILFYGTLTPRRKRTLQLLRSNDLPIFHANAQTDGTFAPALEGGACESL